MTLIKVLLFVSIFMGAVAQLLLKRGMNHKILHFDRLRMKRTIMSMFLNGYVIIGGLTYVTSILLWLVVLSKIELSYAYPLVSMNFVFVTIISRFLFKEKVTLYRWGSILAIIAGVIIVTTS